MTPCASGHAAFSLLDLENRGGRNEGGEQDEPDHDARNGTNVLAEDHVFVGIRAQRAAALGAGDGVGLWVWVGVGALGAAAVPAGAAADAGDDEVDCGEEACEQYRDGLVFFEGDEDPRDGRECERGDDRESSTCLVVGGSQARWRIGDPAFGAASAHDQFDHHEWCNNPECEVTKQQGDLLGRLCGGNHVDSHAGLLSLESGAHQEDRGWHLESPGHDEWA